MLQLVYLNGWKSGGNLLIYWGNNWEILENTVSHFGCRKVSFHKFFLHIWHHCVTSPWEALTMYTYGLSVRITELVKQWCLGKLQVYMFWRKVVGIHEQDFKTILCQCWKNFSYFGKITHFHLTIFKIVKCSYKDSHIFIQKSSDFPVKIAKFSFKNRQIFLIKSYNFPGKVANFFRESLPLFKENLSIFTGKF